MQIFVLQVVHSILVFEVLELLLLEAAVGQEIFSLALWLPLVPVSALHLMIGARSSNFSFIFQLTNYI